VSARGAAAGSVILRVDVRGSTASIRQKFFVDRVINVWNALPSTTNFASSNVLGIALKSLICLVFIVCNISICVTEYAPSDCFY